MRIWCRYKRCYLNNWERRSKYSRLILVRTSYAGLGNLYIKSIKVSCLWLKLNPKDLMYALAPRSSTLIIELKALNQIEVTFNGGGRGISKNELLNYE